MNDYISIAITVLLSALFSGFEIALVSLTPFSLNHARKKILLNLFKNREIILISMIIGNNICIVYATIVLDQILFANLESGMRALAMALETFTFFFLAEMLPKAIFRLHNIKVLIFFFPLIYFILIILFPFAWMFRKLNYIVKRFFKADITPQMEDMVYYIRSHLKSDDLPISKGLLTLSRTHAREIMTPTSDLISFNTDSRVKDVIAIIGKSNYSRYPVFVERGDNIIGYITAYDLLNAKPNHKISQYLYEPRFFPDMLTADKLLFTMQEENIPIAFIVNEYGGIGGLVTLENIAEEIVGDEIIIHEQKLETPDIQKLKENEFLIKGNTDIDDINDYFQLDIPKSGYETMNGYLIFVGDKIPQNGQIIRNEYGQFKIESSDSKATYLIRYSPWESS